MRAADTDSVTVHVVKSFQCGNTWKLSKPGEPW